MQLHKRDFKANRAYFFYVVIDARPPNFYTYVYESGNV
jgi:hypothetical protein